MSNMSATVGLRQVNLADDLERTISLSSTTAEAGDHLESGWKVDN